MYDPKTVAFEIKNPFKSKSFLSPKGYRKSLITIWHVDPEKDGTDDSCRAKLNSFENEVCEDFIKNNDDNLREWFLIDSEDEAIDKIKRIILIHKRRTLRWYQHSRWHFWHWSIQFDILQGFMRKYFHTCAICKKRGFGKQQAVSWNPGIAHMNCYSKKKLDELLQKKGKE